MKFLRNRYAIGGLIVGTALASLLLFLQNSGGITLDNPVLAALWWLLAWPFMFAALFVAFTATGQNMSPGWGLPLLLLAIILNLVYFYALGVFVGFIKQRLRSTPKN